MSLAANAIDIPTPERVNVSLPVAGLGYRTLAYLVDLGLMTAFWLVLYFALTLINSDPWGVFRGWSGVVQTVFAVSLFAAQWVYWTALETLWRGQTVGKRVLRIRVVRDDGAPVGLFESAVRNLLRVVDFLPLLYAGGVLCMLLTSRQRRLGDVLAGTVLVRDERIDLDKYAPAAAPAGGGDALAVADVELILGYLERAKSLAPEARQRLATAMVDRFAAGLSAEERAPLKASVEAAEAFLQGRAGAGVDG